MVKLKSTIVLFVSVNSIIFIVKVAMDKKNIYRPLWILLEQYECGKSALISFEAVPYQPWAVEKSFLKLRYRFPKEPLFVPCAFIIHQREPSMGQLTVINPTERGALCRPGTGFSKSV